MRERVWPILLFTAVLAIAFYIAFQATFYYLITTHSIEEEQSIATHAGGIGVLGRNVALRTTFRNPDFNYDACVIDLRSGPYLLKGPETDEYWSMAIMNRDGEAMFSVGGGGTDKAGPYLVYAEDFPTPSQAAGYKVVEMPQAQGVVIFRLLSDRKNGKSLSDLQDELRCEPYKH